ncbi:GNAT family N-acetyltransferase [Sphingomonas mucosissima]|uniref:Phosphinothricin N-acetyltransferase n=1 Tax=Sphingomonas mucosissima TaxID=370959 RepID=A0A245ZLG0_9SPHN|nr:GNAT family N-acetyltransferase [Sphingomonas mucosissima]OWK30581.1 phosphinothricin N-acetyltransferase [Sphingomonas mucosissima]
MIAIRAAAPADAAPIAAIYAPHVLSGTVSFETEAPDMPQMRQRMAASDGLYPWLVAASGAGEDAAVVGYAYAARFRERAAYRFVVETSIYLASSVQRQGVGRLLYGTLIATLRAQSFTQAIGAIALPNDRSVALHEAAGFRRAGTYREVGYKQGQWVDVGFWQCELNESMVPPAEPRRFADVGMVRA